MTAIYGIRETTNPIPDYRIRVSEYGEQNYWGTQFVTLEQFENATHTLVALDEDYREGSSEQCHDVCAANTPFWTIPEKAWDWLPILETEGCRIAHNVQVKRGQKRYKLIHAAAIMDLFDAEASEGVVDEVYGLDNVVWNGDTISWVRRHLFYRYDGHIPLVFQVLYHNRSGAEHRGSRFGLSGRTFVSQTFKDEYERRALTGLHFYEIARTKTNASSNPRIA